MLSLEENARRLLDTNARRGDGYYYTAPSGKKYPHQWSWDSAFHAIVNCRLGRPELAREEVLTLFSGMTPDGLLPHISFHHQGFRAWKDRLFRFYWPRPGRSPLVQPPVVALAVREIWEKTGDIEFIETTLPFLERHFKWLGDTRRFGDSPLVSILSPWECGLDHKPAFDPLLGKPAKLPFGRYLALYAAEMKLVLQVFDPQKIVRKRYFNVREVLFNTVYALGLEALARIFDDLGNQSKSRCYQNTSETVSDAIWNECFDPATGLCFDIDLNTGKLLAEPSVSCLMPLALKHAPEDKYQSLVDHLTNTEEFWLPFPVPSVPHNRPAFEPQDKRYLWRGPTWINTNWFLANGLRRHGLNEPAATIANASRELAEQFGFREYYNPVTGEGGGEKGFGWSTLAAIM